MRQYVRRFFLRTGLLLACWQGLIGMVFSQGADSIQAHFTVYQCDSLIQANAANPDFCVMDVRTSPEYFPEHLEGAIMRNYNGAGFDSLLDLLPRHKMYLLYCLAGGRSGAAFNKMKAMGFPSIINMLGGIAAWKNAGFPTTPDLAPIQMAVSDTLVPDDTVCIGTTDTIRLTVTNRANDTLRFTSVTSLAGTEFSTDFDLESWLEGPFDYTFSLVYTPTDTLTDSLTFRIESNGGTVQFHVVRTGGMAPIGTDEIRIANSGLRFTNYPNPFTSSTTIEFKLEQPGSVEFTILSQLSQVIDHVVHRGQKGLNHISWHAGSLPAGVYVCRVSTGGETASIRMVVL